MVVIVAFCAGCGKDAAPPPVNVSDGKIIQAMDLVKMGNDFSIGGDTSCMVSSQILNDPDEVAKARADSKTKALVVEASKGGYGVIGEPIFPVSCGKQALAGLDKVKLPKQ